MLLISNSESRDSGSTLVPVIVLTTLGLLIVALLGNLIITSFDFTSRSKAQIQAELAAEAGLILAKQEILNCKAGTTRFDINQTQPKFDVQIRSYNKAGTVASAACPGPGDSVFRVVSTGYSTLTESLLNPSPYSVTMEEVIDYIVAGPVESGPAGLFGGKSGLPLPPIRYGEEGNAPIVFSNGFDCNITIPNDVIVLDGVLTLNSGCRIEGNAWYKQSVVVSGKTVTNPVQKGGVILGTSTLITSDPNQELSVPKDQKWIVIDDKPEDWLNVGFDQIVNVPGSGIDCALPVVDDLQSDPLNSFLTNTTLDTVIDAAGAGGCGANGIYGDLNLTLKSDVVILADKFTLQRLKLRSADSKQRRVWIVVPDPGGSTSVAPCGGADATEKISIKDFDIDIEHVSIMLYTIGTLELETRE